MAKVSMTVILPVRAALWLRYVALEHGYKSAGAYASTVLLGHLNSLSAVDLSQSPEERSEGR